MKWSEGGNGMGVLPRYVRTTVDISDKTILEKHPLVKMWKDHVKFLPYYLGNCISGWHREKYNLVLQPSQQQMIRFCFRPDLPKTYFVCL